MVQNLKKNYESFTMKNWKRKKNPQNRERLRESVLFLNIKPRVGLSETHFFGLERNFRLLGLGRKDSNQA